MKEVNKVDDPSSTPVVIQIDIDNNDCKQEIELPLCAMGSGDYSRDFLQQLKKQHAVTMQAVYSVALPNNNQSDFEQNFLVQDLDNNNYEELEIHEIKSRLAEALLDRNVEQINALAAEQDALVEGGMFKRMAALQNQKYFGEPSQFKLQNLLTEHASKIQEFLGSNKAIIGSHQKIINNLHQQKDYTDFAEQDTIIQQQQQDLQKKADQADYFKVQLEHCDKQIFQLEETNAQQEKAIIIAKRDLLLQEIGTQKHLLANSIEQHRLHGERINIAKLLEAEDWVEDYQQEINNLQYILNHLQQIKSEIYNADFIQAQINCLEKLSDCCSQNHILNTYSVINKDIVEITKHYFKLYQWQVAQIVDVAKDLLSYKNYCPGTVSKQIKQIFNNEIIDIIKSENPQLAENLSAMLQPIYIAVELEVQVTDFDLNLSITQEADYNRIIQYTNGMVTQHKQLSEIKESIVNPEATTVTSNNDLELSELIEEFVDSYNTKQDYFAAIKAYTEQLSANDENGAEKFKELSALVPEQEQQTITLFNSIESYVYREYNKFLAEPINFTIGNKFFDNYKEIIFNKIQDRLLKKPQSQIALRQDLTQRINQTKQTIVDKFQQQEQEIRHQMHLLQSNEFCRPTKIRNLGNGEFGIPDRTLGLEWPRINHIIQTSFAAKLETLQSFEKTPYNDGFVGRLDQHLQAANINEKRQLNLLSTLPTQIEVWLYSVKKATGDQELRDLFTKYTDPKQAVKLRENFDKDNKDDKSSKYKIFLLLLSEPELTDLIGITTILFEINQIFVEKFLDNTLDKKLDWLQNIQAKIAITKSTIHLQDENFVKKHGELDDFLHKRIQEIKQKKQQYDKFQNNLNLFVQYAEFAQILPNIISKTADNVASQYLQIFAIDEHMLQAEVDLFHNNCSIYSMPESRKQAVANPGNIETLTQDLSAVNINIIDKIFSNHRRIVGLQQQCQDMIKQRRDLLQQQQDILLLLKKAGLIEYAKDLDKAESLETVLHNNIEQLRSLRIELGYDNDCYLRELSCYLRGKELTILLKQKLRNLTINTQHGLDQDLKVIDQEIIMLAKTIDLDLQLMEDLVAFMPSHQKQQHSLSLEHIAKNLDNLNIAKKLATKIKNQLDEITSGTIAKEQKYVEVISASQKPGILRFQKSKQNVLPNTRSNYAADAEFATKLQLYRETEEDSAGIINCFKKMAQIARDEQLAKYDAYIERNSQKLREYLCELQSREAEQFSQDQYNGNCLMQYQLTMQTNSKNLERAKELLNNNANRLTVRNIDGNFAASNGKVINSQNII